MEMPFNIIYLFEMVRSFSPYMRNARLLVLTYNNNNDYYLYTIMMMSKIYFRKKCANVTIRFAQFSHFLLTPILTAHHLLFEILQFIVLFCNRWKMHSNISSDNGWEEGRARNAVEPVQPQLWPHVVMIYARQHWIHCDHRRCNRRYALNRLARPMSIALWPHHHRVLQLAILYHRCVDLWCRSWMRILGRPTNFRFFFTHHKFQASKKQMLLN